VAELSQQLLKPENYQVDTRPLCQGMPFVLTDAAHPRLALKHGSHFLILDQLGQIPACNTLGYGYYRQDTRHLSQWELTLNDIPLSLLSSDIKRGYSGGFLYTNPLTGDIPPQKLTVRRQVTLGHLLWEKVTIENFGREAYDVELQMKFHCDFADMFEVRGLNREQRGERMLPQSSADEQKLFLAYRGVDGMMLETIIEFFGCKPNKIVDGAAIFQLHLPVHQPIELELCVDTVWGGHSLSADQPKQGFQISQAAIDDEYSHWLSQLTSITTENQLVNLSLERCFNDIFILRQSTPKGFGLAAGIPWYCTIFGRDSAIAGLQILPFMPEIARECIEILAAYQGEQTNTYTAEQPGRIMHEIRFGEMARAHEIPHIPYYGTIDATELWLLLFCEYIKWTGDLEFAKHLWPAVKLAFVWLDQTLETGNGYLRYQQVDKHELENQGWKDSSDSIMYADGKLAKPPIAVCEAQAYLYAAYREVAKVAVLLGHKTMAKQLEAAADSLKARFRRDFWMESQKYICLALDGENKQADVISSNAGHCLFTDILEYDKAQAVADKLMESGLHSGWGVRTLSGNAIAFSPISYHNGSVWLHDNAIIGQGMRRMGRTEDTKKILHGILDVSFNYPDNRLPELFCGFDRIGSYGPVSYPVSCSPQAWAAGSLLQMIKTCINFQPDAVNNCIRIVEPTLPEWLGKLTIKGLTVGKAKIDLAFDTSNGSTVCQILRKSGNVRIIVET